MRHSVTTPAYLFRKALDNLLYALTVDQVAPDLSKSEELEDPFPTRGPTGWLPLYNMVTFRPDISYSNARRQSQRQARRVRSACWAFLSLTALCGGLAYWLARC